MNSKERVQAALRREPVDRVPIFMWFHPETAVHFGRLLGIPPGKVGDAMDNDVRQAWVNNNYAMEGVVHERDGEGHTDAWGIRWVKEGAFNQIACHPLAEATREELLSYRFPDDQVEDLLAQMLPVVEDANNYFIGCDVSPCVFEMYWRLRGMEPAMLDMAGDPDPAYTMLGRCAAFAMELSRAAMDRYPLDWLWTGDDVAAQQSMIVSPATWRRLIKPHLEPLFRAGKERGLWVAFHCCGSLRPIIGDLVDMGLDVLNPIQCNCPGMDPFELKTEFGADLAFMGGVDTQDLLPHGTADEVYTATTRLIEGMTGDGGGFILAASHTVPPETPDENVFAMYSAAGVSREEILDRAADIRYRMRV